MANHGLFHSAQVGFHSVDVELPEDASEAEVMKTIDDLNNDPAVHGILVQLPLPSHMNVCASTQSVQTHVRRSFSLKAIL